MSKGKEKDELRELVRKVAPPGTTIYTICKKVARSGLSRVISLVAFVPDNEGRPVPFCLDYHASKILKWRLTPDGIMVKGYGMDMGYYLVDYLCHEVYGEGAHVSARGYAPINFDPQKENATWCQCWL